MVRRRAAQHAAHPAPTGGRPPPAAIAPLRRLRAPRRAAASSVASPDARCAASKRQRCAQRASHSDSALLGVALTAAPARPRRTSWTPTRRSAPRAKPWRRVPAAPALSCAACRAVR
jgi:hypothetical protein